MGFGTFFAFWDIHHPHIRYHHHHFFVSGHFIRIFHSTHSSTLYLHMCAHNKCKPLSPIVPKPHQRKRKPPPCRPPIHLYIITFSPPPSLIRLRCVHIYNIYYTLLSKFSHFIVVIITCTIFMCVCVCVFCMYTRI